MARKILFFFIVTLLFNSYQIFSQNIDAEITVKNGELGIATVNIFSNENFETSSISIEEYDIPDSGYRNYNFISNRIKPGEVYEIDFFFSQNVDTNKSVVYVFKVFEDFGVIGTDEGYLRIKVNYIKGCKEELFITETVNYGVTDNQSAQNSITATNLVNNGAIANYNAGTSVFLKSGFKTNAGAKFKAFIEGCSVVANKVSANQEKRVLEDETLSTEENSTINHKAFIKFYPNPTEDTFKIESNSNIAKYIILNQLGKIALSNTVNKSVTNVNIQNLTSGIYFAQITLQNGEIIIKKIIKK